MRMKYIIKDNNYPIIFSEALMHSEVSGKVGVTSAGFVNLVPVQLTRSESKINATVFGESISLGIGSNGDKDNKAIEDMLNREDF